MSKSLHDTVAEIADPFAVAPKEIINFVSDGRFLSLAIPVNKKYVCHYTKNVMAHNCIVHELGAVTILWLAFLCQEYPIFMNAFFMKSFAKYVT